MTKSHEDYIDPDPFTIVALCLSAAGVALQFVQTYKSLNSPDNHSVPKNAENQQLRGLEDALEDIEKHITRIERAVNEGSESPEKEFHKLSFGVSIGILNLKREIHQEFRQDLQKLYLEVGKFSIWANLIISDHPELAKNIGEKMFEQITDADARINALMREGKSNEQILSEVRLLLSCCRNAIQSYRRKRN